jgi:hypothetical protein
MKTISKIALVTTIVVGSTVLSSTQASAFEGKMGGRMRSEGRNKFHLVSQEMKEGFREAHKAEFENLSDEEKEALKSEHRTQRKANRESIKLEVAEFVGVTTDELKDARKNKVSMGELLTQNGKTQEDATSFLTQKANSRVSEISERHDLDEAQTQTLSARVSGFVENIVNKWFQ